MKIAVDVMGTDYGPQELVLGAVQAVRAYDCEVVLVGDSEIIKKLLEEYNAADERKITVHHSSEVINMDEHPGIAVKTKKDASIVVATKLLRDKECDALEAQGRQSPQHCLDWDASGASNVRLSRLLSQVLPGRQ